MSTIVVTGGSGFIGSHVVDALIACGTTVVVIDREAPQALRKNSHAIYIQEDIRSERIHELFEVHKPTQVIHLAAHVDDRASIVNPEENASHNILGTINILQAARNAGVSRIVFASTGVIYGNQEHLPIAEDAAPYPLTPYAIGKLTGERYGKYFSLQGGASFCALRFANVYGPRQDGSKECGAVAIFTKNLLGGNDAFLNGDGTTTRDYVYVHDVVRACRAACESEEEGVINIGTGKETSTQELFSLVAQATDYKARPTHRPEIRDYVAHIALDSAKAKRVLGWEPQMLLQAGIQETVAWYKQQTL